jgi:hypothetical protein
MIRGCVDVDRFGGFHVVFILFLVSWAFLTFMYQITFVLRFFWIFRELAVFALASCRFAVALGRVVSCSISI